MNRDRFLRRHNWLIALIVSLLAVPAWALEITQVRLDKSSFRPDQGDVVNVSFVVSEAARTTLNIYDGRDWLVRAISADASGAGENALTWDGTTGSGEWVPPEAYRFTISATNGEGVTVIHDMTEASAGHDVTPTDIAWDPQTGHVHYRLPEPARVNIRIGLKNFGPLLRTVIDWVPRDAGEQQEAWNGMDQSEVLDLSEHPNLQILIDAFALGTNSILVGPRPNDVQLITDLNGEITRSEQPFDPKQKRMHFHSQQPIYERGDVAIEVTIEGEFPRDEKGRLILSGRVPVRMEVSSPDRQRILDRRFEPVFFVDGAFTFENEVGFVPFTWIWDTTKAHNGAHYVTANLRGYEGNFGMATLQVLVDNSTGRTPP